MARKEKKQFVLPNDIGNSFEDSNAILSYRPNIEFVEPDQVQAETVVEAKPTLDEAQKDVEDLVSGFGELARLADILQDKINAKVKSSGGVEIKLDPIKDHTVIAAMKRKFPDKADPNTITFDDYLQAISCVQDQAPEPVLVSLEDVKAAKEDPYKTDFGGYNNTNGENRPEISSSANAVAPLDLVEFQKNAILALFSMLQPLVIDQIKKVVP